MIDLIKKIFLSKVKNLDPLDPVVYHTSSRIHEEFLRQAEELVGYTQNYALSDLSIYKHRITKLSVEGKSKLLIYVLTHSDLATGKGTSYQVSEGIKRLAANLMQRMPADEPLLLELGERMVWNKLPAMAYDNIFYWPVSRYVNRLVELYATAAPANPDVLLMLHDLRKRIAAIRRQIAPAGQQKILAEIDALLWSASGAPAPRAYMFEEKNNHFGKPMNELVSAYQEEMAVDEILRHAVSANGAQPTKKFQKIAGEITEKIGPAKVGEFLRDVLDLLACTDHNGDMRYPNQYDIYLLARKDRPAIKGLIWIAGFLKDGELYDKLGTVAEHCYRKVPGKGPVSLALGNACLQSISSSDDPATLGVLNAVKRKTRHTGIRRRIDELIEKAADRLDISTQEMQDLMVRPYALEEGIISKPVADYTARIELVRPGNASLKWISPTGKLQKSIPKIIREEHGEALSEIRALKKQLERDSSTLRDRIDRSLRVGRVMSLEYFREKWLGNPLLAWFAERLIWQSTETEAITFLAKPNGFEGPAGEPVNLPDESSLRLWHPILSSPEITDAWRGYLIEREILQPFKQAFREQYPLTAAERTTATYSNRMAAHFLKQHQFNSLAKLKGWRYSLVGAWDHGLSSQFCTLDLPELDLRAEFLILEVTNDDGFNHVGIWNYVSTDQVRFRRLSRSTVLPLTEVPLLAFSEVMRDVDLFVGVASVGNDPNWEDNGGQVPQPYWHNFSFGDLSEVGQNRKLMLERIIPRSKISSVARVEERYVIVEGKIRTYKIHIGSGNILMEPDDRYLCIVPAPNKRAPGTGKIFLPFDVDRTLSIILSKAFLLAEDDSLDDETIIRQIRC